MAEAKAFTTLVEAVDHLVATINNGKYPASDAWLVVRELTRWAKEKYPEEAPRG